MLNGQNVNWTCPTSTHSTAFQWWKMHFSHSFSVLFWIPKDKMISMSWRPGTRCRWFPARISSIRKSCFMPLIRKKKTCTKQIALRLTNHNVQLWQPWCHQFLLLPALLSARDDRLSERPESAGLWGNFILAEMSDDGNACGSHLQSHRQQLFGGVPAPNTLGKWESQNYNKNTINRM